MKQLFFYNEIASLERIGSVIIILKSRKCIHFSGLLCEGGSLLVRICKCAPSLCGFLSSIIDGCSEKTKYLQHVGGGSDMGRRAMLWPEEGKRKAKGVGFHGRRRKGGGKRKRTTG